MAGDTLQPAGGIDEASRLLVGVVDRAQLGAFVQRPFDRDAEGGGYQAGGAVSITVGHAQGAADVADCRLRPQCAEGDDLGHVVVPVALGGVADHLVTPVVREVEVYVRHLTPLYVEEALKDEAIGERVDVGDVQAVEDKAGGGRPAHAHGNVFAPGELGEVVDDQHVVREAGLPHHVQLVLEAAARLVGDRVEAALQARFAELGQMLVGRAALRQVGVWQVEAAELQLQVAGIGDALGVVHGLRQLGEAGAHLGLGLDVVDGRVHAHPLLVHHRGVGADAEQDVVVGGVLGRDVVAIDGSDEGNAGLAGDRHELLVGRRYLR